jgi:S-(hydroxymethyl)glutathione dehydrogenase/alcohol dehydrogenase
VGLPDLMIQAHAMTRAAGTVVLVGMPSKDAVLSLPALSAVFSGKKLVGSVVGDAQILRDFPRYIRFAESGQLDLATLVTSRITLDEVNDGLDALTHAQGTRTVILQPGGHR